MNPQATSTEKGETGPAGAGHKDIADGSGLQDKHQSNKAYAWSIYFQSQGSHSACLMRSAGSPLPTKE